MDEKRRDLILARIGLLTFRRDLSLRKSPKDLMTDIKRGVGNAIKEPELAEISVTNEELIEVAGYALNKVLATYVAAFNSPGQV